jgi:F420-dependent oxidoreductase-like protein
MRFGFWPNPRSNYEDTKTLAQHAEATGWDTLWLADHFLPDEDELIPVHESWITLAALARDVPRVRLGTMVTSNTYRHPAVLANMVTTLDNLSGGRVVLGLGSGWQQNEHEAYGIPYGTAGSRLRMLDEACQVIKGLFTNEYSDFEGEFYQLKRAPLEPKPVQEKLPLMIGGGGEKVTLKIAAKYADEWNVWGDVDTLIKKMKILDQHCETVGRNPAEIERSGVALLFLSEDESYLKRMKSLRMPSPAIIGNVNEVRDIVAAYDEAGVKELIVPDFTLGTLIGAGQEKRDLMEKFIKEVAPVASEN